MQMSRDRVKLFNKEENASVEVIDLQTDRTQPSGTKIQLLLKIDIMANGHNYR